MSFSVGDVFKALVVLDDLLQLSLVVAASESLEMFPDLQADCLALW